MREIKFRAKTATTNRWVYGHYAFIQGHHVIYEDGVPFVIALNTLGQYIGLKDRNGVEIYEHDIFRFGGRNYVIMYNLGSVGCFEDDEYFPLEEIFYRNGEVVGNIYENKELLEREAE